MSTIVKHVYLLLSVARYYNWSVMINTITGQWWSIRKSHTTSSHWLVSCLQQYLCLQGLTFHLSAICTCTSISLLLENGGIAGWSPELEASIPLCSLFKQYMSSDESESILRYVQ